MGGASAIAVTNRIGSEVIVLRLTGEGGGEWGQCKWLLIIELVFPQII